MANVSSLDDILILLSPGQTTVLSGIIGETYYSRKGIQNFVEKDSQLKKSWCEDASRQTIHPHTRDGKLSLYLAKVYHFVE